MDPILGRASIKIKAPAGPGLPSVVPRERGGGYEKSWDPERVRHLNLAPLTNTHPMRQGEETSDAQLITTITRGAEIGLDEVYRRHAAAVYGLAWRVLKSASEAEDVTQEVFLRLWRQPDRFDPTRGTLRSFLLVQAHARAVDTIRTLNARRLREAGDVPTGPDTDDDLLAEYWELSRDDYVVRALEEIHPEERRAIELAFFDGHSYVEVAQLLQQPEGTVKSRIRSGMRRMRGVLLEAGIHGVNAC
jgi:RNA polymerase sigma-70 factor (ECF subfamily)